MRMLAMNNPAIARMLDEQERQKQYQQRTAPTNYGGGAMGNFLTAASGAQKTLGEGASNAVGNLMGREKPKGALEQSAEQESAKAETKSKSVASINKLYMQAMNSKDPVEVRAIISRLASSGMVEASTMVERLKGYELELAKVNKTNASSDNKDSDTVVDRDTGISYNVITAPDGTQTIAKLGTNELVEAGEMKLVTPSVYQSILTSERSIVGIEANKRKEQLDNMVKSLDPKYQQEYYKQVQGIKVDMKNPEVADAKKMMMLSRIQAESNVDTALTNKADYLGTMNFIGEKVKTIKEKRQDMNSLTYQTTSWLGGTDAYDVRADVETLQANSLLESLMMMKEASKNGASGFGNLTEREVDLLISSLGNINPSQSLKQFNKNVDVFYEQFDKIMAKRKDIAAKDKVTAPVAVTQAQIDDAIRRLSEANPDASIDDVRNAVYTKYGRPE